MARQSKIPEIEEKYNQPIEEVIRALYEQGYSQTEAARLLGVSQSTLARWLLVLGLETKTILVERN